MMGCGIGIFPSAIALYRLASLVALVGKNSPLDCFLPQSKALLPPCSNPIPRNQKTKQTIELVVGRE